MFGEPPRTAYDVNFRLFGIPVRISPWFWLAAALLGAHLSGPLLLLIWAVALLVSILVHELGHAVVVRRFGFRPWITLYGFGGLTSYDSQSAYRSPENETWSQILISAAGPAAGFLLAGLLLLVIVACGYRQHVIFGSPCGLTPWVMLPIPRVAQFCNDIFFICVAWGLVNLLPIYPLDGGQIAREIALRVNRHEGIRYSLVLSLIVAIAMAVLAYQQWHDMFAIGFFAILAYFNFSALQAYTDYGPKM